VCVCDNDLEVDIDVVFVSYLHVYTVYLISFYSFVLTSIQCFLIIN